MAKQVRISGLVRAADTVRRELSAPISTERRERLRTRIEANLRAVQQILRQERSWITDLAVPSQRAYHFLAGLDWKTLGARNPSPPADREPDPSNSNDADANAPIEPDPQTTPLGGQIAWRGLNTVIDRAMDALAADVSEKMLDGIENSISRASRRLEQGIRRRSISPDQLTPETRARRGWLGFFSRRENLRTYADARQRASRPLDGAAVGSRHYPPPIAIHFRPLRGIYKLRAARDGAVLSLSTPMIVFDDSGFAALAALIYGRDAGARQQVLGLMTGDAYQTVRAEIESLGGIAEQSRGAIHDLAASFDRVNAAYFNGAMARPHLTWNRTFTGRKFGHYDWINDTLMVSRTLDQARVPEFVVDCLVFHELLHKYHGLHWVNGRGYAHTSEFQRDERKFAQYEEAEAILQRLAESVR